MGIHGLETIDHTITRLDVVLADFTPDWQKVGEVAASGVIQWTLAGIGAGDQAFAPYSASYQRQLDAVGGKVRQTVDMRGIFLKEGQKLPKYRSEKRMKQMGAGKQGKYGVAFVSLTTGIHVFEAKTKVTRPANGITDPYSEMSLDLLAVQAFESGVTITYNPRKEDYMVAHNDGAGRAPQREWFTLDRAAIKAAVMAATTAVLSSRVERFNAA